MDSNYDTNLIVFLKDFFAKLNLKFWNKSTDYIFHYKFLAYQDLTNLLNTVGSKMHDKG